eukprot:scaffold1172_cov247-Pinguiococcus_pyrenoidosus.AAC.20
MGRTAQSNPTAAADLWVHEAMRRQVNHSSGRCYPALHLGKRGLAADENVGVLQTEEPADIERLFFRALHSFQWLRMTFQKPRGTDAHPPHEILGRNAVSLRIRHLHFVGSVVVKLTANGTLARSSHLHACTKGHCLAHSEEGHAFVERHLAILPKLFDVDGVRTLA